MLSSDKDDEQAWRESNEDDGMVWNRESYEVRIKKHYF